MSKKQTPFEILLQNNICFAVCVSYVFIKNINDYTTKLYSILLHNSDFKKLPSNKRNFNVLIDHPGIHEHTLTNSEINQFQNSKNQFKCVKSTSDGRIYELTENSFKKHITNHEKN